MGDVSKIKVEPCNAVWGGLDLGFLNGDIEVATTEDAVDVTAHQTGKSILDAIRIGKTASIKLELKEADVASLKSILAVGGDVAAATAEVTKITALVAASLQSKYFFINSADDAIEYYVWINVNSAGVDPAPAGKTAVPVAVATGATAAQVATAIAAALDALTGFVSTASGAVVTVTNAATGPTTDAVDGNSAMAIEVTTQGSGLQTGWGVSKDFHNMAADSKKLVLHPVAADDTDSSRDLVFWKAYPSINSIKISGENPRTVSVSFRIFQDPARPKETRLFAVGDSR